MCLKVISLFTMHIGGIYLLWISCILTAATEFGDLPVRLAVFHNHPRINVICLWDDGGSDMREIVIWYNPYYPTRDNFTLYNWTYATKTESIYDPLKQNRISVSVQLDKGIDLFVHIAELTDSGVYFCKVASTTRKGQSTSVKLRITGMDIDDVHCDISNQVIGKIGTISCFYLPYHSTPRVIIWKRKESEKKIYSYSFLHARGKRHYEHSSLHKRLSHKLELNKGKVSLKIVNTSFSDAGTYKIGVMSISKNLWREVNYSVIDGQYSDTNMTQEGILEGQDAAVTHGKEHGNENNDTNLTLEEILEGQVLLFVAAYVFLLVIPIVYFINWQNKAERFRRPWDLDTGSHSEEPLLNEDTNNKVYSWGRDLSSINSRTANMLKDMPDCKPIVVGIMSSGFDTHHPIFKPPLLPPLHHIAVKGTRGMDPFGQGTFLAGLIIQLCTGVRRNLQLINLQAVSGDGTITRTAIDSCLRYCVDPSNVPDILLIPNCFTHEFRGDLFSFLETLVSETTVIISASNDCKIPEKMEQLGKLEKLIIGSHDENEERCQDSPDYLGVDFLAPGDCVSAKAGSGQYVKGKGTVVAAAWTCGVVVHIMQQAAHFAKKQELSVQLRTRMIRNLLREMARDKKSTPGNGYGPLKPGLILLKDDKLSIMIKAYPD